MLDELVNKIERARRIGSQPQRYRTQIDVSKGGVSLSERVFDRAETQRYKANLILSLGQVDTKSIFNKIYLGIQKALVNLSPKIYWDLLATECYDARTPPITGLEECEGGLRACYS